jgi:hypothetical protein
MDEEALQKDFEPPSSNIEEEFESDWDSEEESQDEDKKGIDWE